MEEQRICKIHGLTTFVYRPTEKRWRCKKCNVENVNKRRKELKKKAVIYKGGKCQLCGYNKCLDALEFHHLDPTKKDFGLSERGLTRKWSKVLEELDKCILVCSNCHKEIHSK